MSRIVLTVVLIKMIAFVPTVACAQTNAPPLYDGTWWNSVTYSRQIGFLSGYDDCYIYDRGNKLTNYRTTSEARRLVDKYYANADRANIPISVVLRRVTGDGGAAPEGGNLFTDKHGFFDGEWWHAGSEESVGFVEGYIQCIPGSDRMYPKEPEYYVKKINEWYSNKEHLGDKIANVVQRYAAK